MIFKSKIFAVYLLALFNTLSLLAQKDGQGSISGTIIEKSSGKPLEVATFYTT